MNNRDGDKQSERTPQIGNVLRGVLMMAALATLLIVVVVVISHIV